MKTRAKNALKHGLIVAGLLLLLLPQAAYACEMCFGGGAEGATTRGISMAMLSLLITTGLVGSGIGAFFINMRKRAKRLDPGTFVVTEQGEIRPLDPDKRS